MGHLLIVILNKRAGRRLAEDQIDKGKIQPGTVLDQIEDYNAQIIVLVALTAGLIEVVALTASSSSEVVEVEVAAAKEILIIKEGLEDRIKEVVEGVIRIFLKQLWDLNNLGHQRQEQRLLCRCVF
jgi:hypothetical protein